MRNLTRFGHVTQSGNDALLCDLTAPIHAGTMASFQLIDGPAYMATGSVRSWRWSISYDGKTSIDIKHNDLPLRIDIPDTTSLGVQGEILLSGNSVVSISQTYQVASVPSVKNMWGSGNNLQRAIIEISTDLAQYIEVAAAATGTKGVSARFIAAVLLIEVTNRPKTGRFDELDEVREEIGELMQQRHGSNLFRNFNFNIFLHKSIGLGQTKMSTLAMALGWMPLFEHPRVPKPGNAEDEIKESFMKLTTDQMFELWRRLSWSKSAVGSVANILAHLKNRPNRYPNLSRSDFAADYRAMAIIATEYNMGATNSPESRAGPTWYGDTVASICRGQNGGSYLAASRTFQTFTHP